MKPETREPSSFATRERAQQEQLPKKLSSIADPSDQKSVISLNCLFDVDGKDLAELLIENGYARVFGTKTDYPDGQDAKDIEAMARKVAAEFKPEKIILFGSYAYGKPGPDSDIDLLVVLPHAASTSYFVA